MACAVLGGWVAWSRPVWRFSARMTSTVGCLRMRVFLAVVRAGRRALFGVF